MIVTNFHIGRGGLTNQIAEQPLSTNEIAGHPLSANQITQRPFLTNQITHPGLSTNQRRDGDGSHRVETNVTNQHQASSRHNN